MSVLKEFLINKPEYGNEKIAEKFCVDSGGSCGRIDFLQKNVGR
jgi:hypothetical protein